MGMTMTQKILAAHAGLDSVCAGQLILAKLDRVLGNDITSPVAIKEFSKLGKDSVYDKDKVTMVMDHFAPNKDIKAAEQCKMCRDFCNDKEVTHFYDAGQMGIEHALLPEKGLVTAGDVVIGADSHTCTYGALGAFSTGVGSTDMACGMAVGKAWFKVPSAIKFNLTGKLNKYVSGKDWYKNIRKDLPIFLVAGDEDPVGEYGKGVKQVAEDFKKTGHTAVHTKLYKGMRHEILNEVERQSVMNDILEWADAQIVKR